MQRDFSENMEQSILEDCSYECMDWDGNPVNPGKLLSKYGKDCAYSIRDKAYEVSYDGSVGLHRVDWITQSVPIEPALGMLVEAIGNAIPKGESVLVSFDIRDRDGYESIRDRQILIEGRQAEKWA